MGVIPFAVSTEKSSMLMLQMQQMDSNFTVCIGFKTESAKNGDMVRSKVMASASRINQIVRVSVENLV